MPPSCELLCVFAIGARAALLWQHSTDAKCQHVLVVALWMVDDNLMLVLGHSAVLRKSVDVAYCCR